MKRILPQYVQELRVRLIVARNRRRFKELSVEETFQRIYAENLWGPLDDFDSGDGSTKAHLTEPYVVLVRNLVDQYGVKSVADLGCGDFRVGQSLLSSGLRYTGVDVVKSLIERNRRLYGSEHIAFRHLDVINDELPRAEMALMRQVLQHLSNDEISAVLENTRSYRYLIVTEHVSIGNRVIPNIDKPHGPDVRVTERSGVFLDKAPFLIPTQTLLEVQCAPDQVLRTVLVQNDKVAP